jgi:hypothetical protein
MPNGEKVRSASRRPSTEVVNPAVMPVEMLPCGTTVVGELIWFAMKVAINAMAAGVGCTPLL